MISAPVVPTLLKSRRQWLCWKLVQAPGEPKPRKVPFYANGAARNGDQGTPEDLAQLSDFNPAMAACQARGYTGLGFALLSGSGLVALDFDHCVRDGHILDRRIEALIANTYAEISPSGTTSSTLSGSTTTSSCSSGVAPGMSSASRGTARLC
jgi:primase-polymerase (primpol)-like protein